MSENNRSSENVNNVDQGIKLFGRTIPLSDAQISSAKSEDSSNDVTKAELDSPSAENSNGLRDGKYEHTDTNNGSQQDKLFKKPDKIIPCPRCKSSDTKFCYFNNYNVNQPRHFCKNCQRYWTAGGAMRNVPVGAGRRKNKHLASHFQQMLASGNGTQINRLETTSSGQTQLLTSDESSTGKVLRFGPDQVPLSESMETMLTLGDPKGFSEMNSANYVDREQDPQWRSAMARSDDQRSELHENLINSKQVCLQGGNEPGPSHPLHCYPIPPLVFSWNPGWNNVHSAAKSQYFQQLCVSNSSALSQVQWLPTKVLPSDIPLQFVPASYWSCMPVWASQTGNVSLTAGSFSCVSSSSPSNNGYSGNKSPTLGKHSRDSEFMDTEPSEMYVSVPKSMRIDDSDEASRNPIQTTFGIKLDKEDLVGKGSSVHKKLTHKIVGKDNVYSSPVLEANPAAFSRSHTFQESA